MKTYKSFIPVVALAIVGLLLFHPASARLAKADSGCKASTIHGSYGLPWMDSARRNPRRFS